MLTHIHNAHTRWTQNVIFQHAKVQDCTGPETEQIALLMAQQSLSSVPSSLIAPQHPL